MGVPLDCIKRTGVKQWENLTQEATHPNVWADINKMEEHFIGDQVGFAALAGFAHNDLYAGGNSGDCWHYNGEHWRKKDLPLNSDISTIVCAPEGVAYIACRLGPVLAGRDNQWETIDDFKEISHSAWFQGRIYFLSNNGRIYSHNKGDKQLSEATFASDFPPYMHANLQGLAACDDCLVVYTGVQAYAYDGHVWHEIVEIPSLSKHNKA